jgi:hypothetical protein
VERYDNVCRFSAYFQRPWTIQPMNCSWPSPSYVGGPLRLPRSFNGTAGPDTSIDPDDSPRLRSPILEISGLTRTQFTVDVGRGSLCGAYAETTPALRNIMPVP